MPPAKKKAKKDARACWKDYWTDRASKGVKKAARQTFAILENPVTEDEKEMLAELRKQQLKPKKDVQKSFGSGAEIEAKQDANKEITKVLLYQRADKQPCGTLSYRVIEPGAPLDTISDTVMRDMVKKFRQSHQGEPVMTITSFFVSKNFRGQYASLMLLEEVRRACMDGDVDHIMWLADDDKINDIWLGFGAEKLSAEKGEWSWKMTARLSVLEAKLRDL